MDNVGLTKEAKGFNKSLAKKILGGSALVGAGAGAGGAIGHSKGKKKGAREIAGKFNQYNKQENRMIARKFYNMGKNASDEELNYDEFMSKVAEEAFADELESLGLSKEAAKIKNRTFGQHMQNMKQKLTPSSVKEMKSKSKGPGKTLNIGYTPSTERGLAGVTPKAVKRLPKSAKIALGLGAAAGIGAGATAIGKGVKKRKMSKTSQDLYSAEFLAELDKLSIEL